MKNRIEKFEVELLKRKGVLDTIISPEYDGSPDDFITRSLNTLKRNNSLLNCTASSVVASMIYFAEFGLDFNTPEGYGYILSEQIGVGFHAVPLLGYRGLIEIAYRNPRIKNINIQAVYQGDDFVCQSGTEPYLHHARNLTDKKGDLLCVYAVAHIDGLKPQFVVVSKEELDYVQTLSRSGNLESSAYNNGLDVFNVMQSKVAFKLLFKTLPKTNSRQIAKALDLDNKIDYEKARLVSVDSGYQLVYVEEKKSTALDSVEIKPIQVRISDKIKPITTK